MNLKGLLCCYLKYLKNGRKKISLYPILKKLIYVRYSDTEVYITHFLN